jgi:hypothetical protein
MLKFKNPALMCGVCICAAVLNSGLSAAEPSRASATPAPAIDSAVVDSMQPDKTPHIRKLTGTVMLLDRAGAAIAIKDAHGRADTLSLGESAPVTCGDLPVSQGDCKAGDAVTLTYRAFRGSRTVISIARKGCGRSATPPQKKR